MLKAEYFENYVRQGISPIPLKKTWDDKKNCYTGKRAAVKGWQELCEELPDSATIKEWESISNCSGIAYACGEGGNLACVDLDTEDMTLAKRIEQILPYTP